MLSHGDPTVDNETAYPPVTGEIERFREILAEEYARENVYSKDASLKATYAKRLERAALSAMRRVALDRAGGDVVRVTDEMVEAACVAYYDKTHHSDWRLLSPTPFGNGNRAAKDKFRIDMRAALEAALSAVSIPRGEVEFQARVQPWMMACFGPEISADKLERNDRFIEEALELVQASGYTQDRAHALVDYTFNRPQGDINQEVGGVMVTLAAHCLANGVNMHEAGETELKRIWTKVDQIRAKQAAKPRGSALPVSEPLPPAGGWRDTCEPVEVEQRGVPEPHLLHEWQSHAFENAARVLEEEAKYCAAVAADERDFLPVRASAFEKSETMKRCAATIRTLKHISASDKETT